MISGALLGQFITFLGMPILSRIYPPYVFGEYNIILSSGNILGVFLCLGLITAIMLPSDDAKAIGLCRIMAISLFGLTTMFLVVVLIGSQYFKIFSVDSGYLSCCVLLYFYLIFSNLSSIIYAYANRLKRYRVLFWNPLIYAGGNILFSIIFGLLGWGVHGYLLGSIVGFVVGVLAMLRYSNPFVRMSFTLRLSAVFHEYSHFTYFQMPANLVSTLSSQFPIQMISLFFGNAVLGSYTMAMRILGLPAQLIANPINRVYYRQAAELENKGESIGEFSFQIIRNSIRIAILPIAALIVFAQPLFTFFLGASWSQAGSFASSMGVYCLLQFCATCVSGGLLILKKPQINLTTSIMSLLLNVFCSALIYFFELSPLVAITLFSWMNSVYYAINLALLLVLSKFALKRFILFLFTHVILVVSIAHFLKQLIFA